MDGLCHMDKYLQFKVLSAKHLSENLFHSGKGPEKDTIGCLLKSTVRGRLVQQD